MIARMFKINNIDQAKELQSVGVANVELKITEHDVSLSANYIRTSTKYAYIQDIVFDNQRKSKVIMLVERLDNATSSKEDDKTLILIYEQELWLYISNIQSGG